MQILEGERGLIGALPSIERYQSAFMAQNKLLSRTTLTGKISSLEQASTLFEFMEETHRRFGSLQERLIGCLVEESIKSAALEATSRAQAVIDTLIRNLFERTADVGFLATDEDLVAFLAHPDGAEIEQVKRRLEEYVRKYTVYRNIKLLSPEGKERVSLTTRGAHFRSEQLPQKEPYQEIFRSEAQGAELFYLSRMHSGDQAVGVLVLDFDFEAEMAQIYRTLAKDLGGILALTDAKNRVISSSDTARLPVGSALPLSEPYRIVILAKRAYLAVGVKTKGYEGFYGQPWQGVALIALDRTSSSAAKSQESRTVSLLPESLREIVSQAEEITEDLGDVVINGELIASKTRTYSLNPVLENIRAIGEQTQQIFIDSLGNLEQTVISSLLGDVALLSRLAVEIMDRNLYERANDCRWWALSTHFRKSLAQGALQEADQKQMGEILAYINSLYTVYTLLYLYDKEGRICAVSSPESAHLIGQDVRDNCTQKALANRNTQHYFVSDFAPSPLYDSRPTYIYHATVLSPEGDASVGGIGIVFDSQPQFEAILTDMLPQDHGGAVAGAFNLFVDGHDRVIASTHSAIKPGDRLPDALRERVGVPAGLCHYEGCDYIAASAISEGYREYKRSDGYQNPITALTFLPAKRG